MHETEFLFTLLSATFLAEVSDRFQGGRLVQPTGKVCVRFEPRCFMGKLAKDSLGDFLGVVESAEFAEGGGIDEVDVAFYQFGKCGLRTGLDVLL